MAFVYFRFSDGNIFYSFYKIMIIILKSDFFLFFLFTDADCGRGFSLIEHFCVNLSMTQASPTDIPSSCQSIQAGQLTSPTPMMLFLLKVNFNLEQSFPNFLGITH